MGYKGQKPRTVSSGAMLRAAEEGRTNGKQVFLSVVACSTPLCQLSTQTCLSSKREGKMDKLDKPLAHPSTWKVTGVDGEEEGAKQSKSCFVLMVYSWDKQMHSQALCVLSLSFKGGKRRRRSWSGGGSKEQLGLSRREAREVKEVRGTGACSC